MAKKTVKEPEAQTMGGKPIEKPKKTAKKAAPKKKGKTKAEILAKPTKVVRKSVVKNEEHSDFEDSADLADDVERDELDADDLVGEEETDDSIEY
jgi:hypothetical protein